jgi:hypothetical protein
MNAEARALLVFQPEMANIETTERVTSKPSRARALMGLTVAVLLGVAGLALAAFAQILPALAVLAIAAIIGTVSGLSFWAAKADASEGQRGAGTG